MNNTVMCKICKRKFKTISRTHLKTHNMTMKEYQKKFPDANMHSDYTRQKLSTNRLEYWVNKHGEIEGERKYEEYKKFLAEKNTYPYKKKKFGWNEEQFKKYNLSRAVTLDNLIQKHGTIKGTKKYNDYVEKQCVQGVTEEYFIEKLGMVEGKKRYRELGKQKAHTLETYIKRYGDEDTAKEKLRNFFKKIKTEKFSSMIEREFVHGLIQELDENIVTNNKIYSSLHGTQFGIWSKSLNKLTKYDFTIPSLKVCIEFNGDYWHCNPRMYNSDFIHPKLNITAKELWEKDELKKQDMENEGYNFKTVWEIDYRKNKQSTIKDTVEWIQKLNEQKLKG